MQKKHPKGQVEHIANSIREFGFQQPIVIDKNNEIVIGHGRLMAAKKLKIKTVPCVRVDNLTEQQVKALRLADNKVAESEWDDDFLNYELTEIIDFDMADFGFDLDSLDSDLDSETETETDSDTLPSSLTHNVFENQERMQFYTENWYGIPDMTATETTGNKLLRFCDYGDIDREERSEYIAHFYYDDFKFIQAWRDPDKYVDKLREFKAVISPDFSLYTDFPRALQILSCYRRQWCGAYWQSLGIDVIPDVVWGDKESFKFCFDGIPTGGTVAVSSVGVKNDVEWNGVEGQMFVDGYNEMLKRLEPSTIIFYGDLVDGLEGNIIHVPSYYAQKRETLNQQKKLRKEVTGGGK